MHDVLHRLAGVLADPGAETAAAELDAVRGIWRTLDPEERAAVTPLAQLAARRVAAADRGRAPSPGGSASDAPAAGPPAVAAPAVEAAHPQRSASHGDSLADVSPESLLPLLGLSSFRPGQREAVQAALDGRDSLVVMPTGGGKSLCYQLPALAGDDLTVVVSPLIALMRDQCARLTDLGHPAVMLASGGDGDANRRALDEIRDGTAKVCFAAPERFASSTFRAAIRQRTIALFVVDEAHCVSEWGHDFRPDYLRLASVIDELGRPPVMACTATATPKVADEIVARLGLRDAERVRSGFDRPNLSFDVLPFDGQGSVARKRATLVAGISDPANRPAVVYCGTRKSTEEVRDLLVEAGISAVGYHAGMAADVRTARQDAFMRGDADVVVATNAFGMGVDKADVRSVWHWGLPSSLEAYYQEAGRAGRDGALGRAVLLASRADLGRLVRFIQQAEVTVGEVGALIGRLRAQAGPGGEVELAGGGGGSDRDRIALAIAERAGAIALAPGEGGRLQVRVLPGEADHRRISEMCRAAKDRRWQAYRSIEQYASTENEVCRRRQLLDHFGDPEEGAPLGRCCDVHDPVDWLPPITVKGGRSRSAAPVEEEGRPVGDDELEPLKAWRRERADGKPAYTVATDAVLREIARRRPKHDDELLAIKGIGASFVAKHGEALLDLLDELPVAAGD
ncbi:ATP-dependent DNA helicase RecQ [Patulibacter brassicae]|uniref:DNA 3'-5' helicase n=1 Tax=Patulibacter brassicae TaxID=1705717 RepID=A0ABU4VJT3_9ACTN|nr:ATP-dependent DNA helicase RecQ [Patulibacter brassicae]MDX8152111.1 ATP-dependent DNA helicase RecQ [Patulibacter brassicae]